MDWQSFNIIFTVSTLITLNTKHHVTGDCEYSINQEVSLEPLLLTEKQSTGRTIQYDLLTLKDCKLKIKSNQRVLLACPGKGNYLNQTKDAWNEANCANKNRISIEDSTLSYDTLECRKRPQAIVKFTGRQCYKNNGVIINAGFEVNKSWYPLLEICHSLEKSHTYYVKHSLVYPTTACVKTPNTRPAFIEGDKSLYSTVNMADVYSTQYQLIIFKEMFGTDGNNYINKDEMKFLARGHLAPDADFPIDAWRTLTYFYINTAPQWQSINAGSWVNLEGNIRKLSSKLDKLQVITGTHGILKIDKKDIYLGNKEVPVPEYFWKLVHNPADDSCMGFVTRNNPFIKRQSQSICPDVCNRYNWNFRSNQLFYGHTNCCEYHQLVKVVDEVPNIRCKSALRFY